MPVQLEAGLREATSGRAHKGFVHGLCYPRAEGGLKENPCPWVMGEGLPEEWAELGLP